MKKLPLLLAVSFVANLALAAGLFFRSPFSVSAPTASPAGISRVSSVERVGDKNASTLAAGDVAALQAAGFPADLARELTLGRAVARLIERNRANKSTDDRWWAINRPGSARAREEQLKARREFSDALIATFGEDPIFGASSTQFSFLPPAKRDALRRITQDYDEMLASFSADGIQLASDREKQKLLLAERDRDIAALLAPEELAAYQMRTSTSGAVVRSRYGDAIASEDEFAKIFALQKAYDEKFPREALTGRITSEVMSARAAAERQLQADIEAAVGSDRFAALRRGSDPDLRTLDALAQRLNLPAHTTDGIVASRDSYAAESQRINSDTSLTPQQRRTQIQDLGNRAKSELARTLGTEGADAYAQRSAWLSMLQGGTAFSNTPPATGHPGALLGSTQSVYPVFPAGANVGGRGGVITSDVVTSGSTFSIGTGIPIQRDNLQVMTFVTGPADANGPPPTGAAPVIVRRADPTQAGSFPPSTSTVIEVPAQPIPAPTK